MSQPLVRSRMKVDASTLAKRELDEPFKDAVYRLLAGKADRYQVLYDNVLVASYVAREKTQGGIILTDRSIDEDRWQGVVGMVLQLGNTAFKYDGAFEYTGPKPKVGDFVTYHTSDTREIGINGVSCRIVSSALIRAIVDDPEVLY